MKGIKFLLCITRYGFQQHIPPGGLISKYMVVLFLQIPRLPIQTYLSFESLRTMFNFSFSTDQMYGRIVRFSSFSMISFETLFYFGVHYL